jgi:hypothetical protein
MSHGGLVCSYREKVGDCANEVLIISAVEDRTSEHDENRKKCMVIQIIILVIDLSRLGGQI